MLTRFRELVLEAAFDDPVFPVAFTGKDAAGAAETAAGDTVFEEDGVTFWSAEETGTGDENAVPDVSAEDTEKIAAARPAATLGAQEGNSKTAGTVTRMRSFLAYRSIKATSPIYLPLILERRSNCSACNS